MSDQQFAALFKKIEELQGEMRGGFSEVQERFDRLEFAVGENTESIIRLENRMDKVEMRIEQVHTELSERIDGLSNRIDENTKEMRTKMLTLHDRTKIVEEKIGLR
jgi:DNA-binding ferritin-like protein